MSSDKGFTGAKFRFGDTDRDKAFEGIELSNIVKAELGGKILHADQWRNMRPICPYGCGHEGNLLEVIVRDGKALGIYTHDESMKPFTADLQMAPKPTGRKIVIGADGEPHLVEEI